MNMLAYFLYCRQLLLAVVLIEFPPRLCGNTLRFYSYHLPLSTCHISDSFYLTSRTTSNLLFCHLLYCHQKSHQKSHQKKTTGYLKLFSNTIENIKNMFNSSPYTLSTTA
ncbi:U78 [Human betaherpesvirus 6A]|uniref:Uncharacterized protein U78 n=2 Tax=Human betaherpesvirus 6A TaxID=32603 RepID=U78_HHV6U|nr:RecName: Full=Uncharacterized protein U78; Flags: Precursor [Human herpesvirus 6 (strain Uganda-1102)]AAA68469.1 unknown [Human betaherpesvirus 6A]AHK06921.1 U78 [Human betaherpesvirus 6A]AVI07643.1 hypothetical protein [Human betaherpesvirus 6A]AVI07764.1 hypothetical protein [Human betaherpesvirus 6A]AVI08262.1 hypothetical protein [Human betaherpesvirus 6A]